MGQNRQRIKKKRMRDYAINDGLSLSKLAGKKIVDVVGRASDPFGGTPLFEILYIILEDGTQLRLDGEHDVAYIPSNDKIPNLDEETLQSFIDEDNA